MFLKQGIESRAITLPDAFEQAEAGGRHSHDCYW
jgi:hypothetical protein